MNRMEEGFLLLTSRLGNPERKPLTLPQLGAIAKRAYILERYDWDVELDLEHLTAMGCGREEAQRVLALLSEEELLHAYLDRARRQDCHCITRAWETYPQILRSRLGMDSPGSLWLKGDASLLDTPAISLVGSRDLNPENLRFAEAVGIQAAKQGFTLISGNARGADTIAQEACLASGGKVISVVADRLADHPVRKNVLYVSEDGFDEPFSNQRALHRNHVIHALGRITFAAQCTLGKGGTWNGSTANLRHGWSPLYCFNDGSEAVKELVQMGAIPIGFEELEDLTALLCSEKTLFD